MNDDQEINNLKKLFSDDKPTELQKHNWKVALRSKQQSHKKYFFWTQMTAAASIGFVIGGMLFSGLKLKTEVHKESLADDATIEMIYTKL